VVPSNRFNNYIKNRQKVVNDDYFISDNNTNTKLKSEDMCYSESENSQFRFTGKTDETPFRCTSDF
jgi:hypothetical protein